MHICMFWDLIKISLKLFLPGSKAFQDISLSKASMDYRKTNIPPSKSQKKKLTQKSYQQLPAWIPCENVMALLMSLVKTAEPRP